MEHSRYRFGARARGKERALSPLVADRSHALARPRLVLVAVVGLTAFGGALRFSELGMQSFWNDEVVTWDLLRRPLGSLLFHGIPAGESTPPLYYAVAWVWVRVFGWSETALRSLSAVAGTLTVPVVFAAARTLANLRTAFIAAALVAASPILVWYSQEARAYALLTFFAACSFYFFARLMERYSPRVLAAWTCVAILAVTTHYFAYALVAGELVFLSRRLPRQVLLVAVAPLAAVTVPLAKLAQMQSGNAAGLSRSTSLTVRVEQLGRWFAAGDAATVTACAIVAAAGVVAVALLLRRRGGRQRQGGILALSLAGVAVALPFVLVAGGHDYVFFRNFIAVWPLLAIAVAAGLATTRDRFLGAAATGALLAVFLAADVNVPLRHSLQRDDYRALASALGAPAGGEAVVVYPGWDSVPLRHYEPGLVDAGAAIDVRELVFVGVRSQFSAWRAPAALRLDIPAGFTPTGTVRMQHFVIRRFAARRPATVAVARLDRLARDRKVPTLHTLAGDPDRLDK